MGGSTLFGAIGGIAGGIAGGIFGGPIGGMIGSAVGGLLDGAFSADEVKPGVQNQANDTIGGAVTGAAQQLAQNHGMPQFLADEISSAVQTVVGGMQQPTAPGVDEHVQNTVGEQFAGHQEELIKTIVTAVMEALEGNPGAAANEGLGGEHNGCKDAAAAGDTTEADQAKLAAGNLEGGKDVEDSKGRKHSAGSWMQAMAKAMGGTLGKKAAEMVKLSNQVSQHTDKASAMKEANAQNAKDGGEPDQVADAQQQNEAAKATQTQTELQAVGQEFKMMTDAFSNAIKTIGESLSTLGRKG
jgi:hypothetical protein